nr:uncharacterized protein LOC114921776 [Labrus bergylta]
MKMQKLTVLAVMSMQSSRRSSAMTTNNLKSNRLSSKSINFGGCWISVSGSESQTVEVQSGEDVTLMCSGMDEQVSVRYWLKLVVAHLYTKNQAAMVKGTNIQCVSTMTSYNSTVTYRDGFSNHKFTMLSNTSTIFLKVRSVELNDSGIYYCGFNKDGRPFLTTIHLKINECDGAATLVSVVLRGLTLLLVMVVIGLVLLKKDRIQDTVR